MATPYPGYQPLSFSVQPSGYGRWVTGMAADDGDDDDAAHLMALAMATMDDVQFLGWRAIDWQNPGTVSYSPKGTVVFAVNGAHGWRFGCALDLTSATDLFVDAGGVLRIGRPGSGGSVGKILCAGDGGAAGSEVRAVNGAPIVATDDSYVYASGAGSGVAAYNGAELKNDALSPFNQYGPHTKHGADASTALRPTSVGPNATVSDGTAFDVITVTGVGTLIISGSVATSQSVTLNPPANGTRVGICVRFTAPKESTTTGTPGDLAYLEIATGAGPTRYTAYSKIDGSGKTKSVMTVDLMVESAGGSARKWVAVMATGAGLEP